MSESPKIKYDNSGPLHFMVQKSGWVMCRRMGEIPFVMTVKEWNALSGVPRGEAANAGNA